MLAETTTIRITTRRVIDTRTMRSQPRAMQVSLPALRCLGEVDRDAPIARRRDD
jgi:hypothetical protein